MSFSLRWCALAALVAPAYAQIEEMVFVNMRVTSTMPRTAVVDRGVADGLTVNDRVVFTTREGARFEGTVKRVEERQAAVELDDASFVPAPGTRGQARVPKSRIAAPAPTLPSSGETLQPQTTETAPAAPDHPPWERVDDDWTTDQPLLARIRPFRPSEREPVASGRVYTFLDHISNTEGNRSDTFARVGTDLRFENLFRKGGSLHLDGEFNARRTSVPDDDNENRQRFRLDRASYSFGGNRFDPDRYELGRFLQYGMPEFGVLDGVEWGRRLSNGDTFGVSAGFMPEPNAGQDSGHDLQFAGYYRYVVDESEMLSIEGGYQKTFHDLAADRDLFVAKVVYLPPAAWTFSATAWIDYYTGGDVDKSSGPEVTQAYVTTGRRFESGSSLRATYTHRTFPVLDRDEFLPVTAAQLANDHFDRASISGRQAVGRYFELFGQAGVWQDEDDNGGDAEAGFEVKDFMFDDLRVEAAGFGTNGQFSSTLGWRTALGAATSHGLWRLGYDFTLNRIDGFSADNDDIPQHRVRASFETHGDSGWSFSTYSDVLLFDSETAVVVGLFLQRSF
ncbi:MAG: hypothetical protein JNL28_00495 [Planctomycetes bacterium]|nr:hypothetical protein [Planctomycetota bacterium]